MALAYAEQFDLAENNQEFRNRVCAASFGLAVTAQGAAANADPVIQGQRLTLAAAVVRDRAYAEVQFAYWLVTRPTVGSESDLTDAFIAAQLTVTVFDRVAQVMFPVPV